MTPAAGGKPDDFWALNYIKMALNIQNYVNLLLKYLEDLVVILTWGLGMTPAAGGELDVFRPSKNIKNDLQ